MTAGAHSPQPAGRTLRFSIVITNRNYSAFVGRAIESALGQGRGTEVVVVDDGSSDGSPALIERYGEAIRFIRQANAGQLVAATRGFQQSTGDVVIFLDSDDELLPGATEQIEETWRPGLSKVQYQLQRCDAEGRRLGRPFPGFRPVPSAGDIRRWFAASTAYPTPPGSGNAYARDFLEKILPCPAVDSFLDSVCLAAAPVLGDVATVDRPLALYRLHGGNDSDLSDDPSRFAREVRRAASRADYARTLTRLPESLIPALASVRRSREVIGFRVAARRLVPDETSLAGDSFWRLALDVMRSPMTRGPETITRRLALAVWGMAALVAPRPVAAALIRRRYRRTVTMAGPA